MREIVDLFNPLNQSTLREINSTTNKLANFYKSLKQDFLSEEVFEKGISYLVIMPMVVGLLSNNMELGYISATVSLAYLDNVQNIVFD